MILGHAALLAQGSALYAPHAPANAVSFDGTNDYVYAASLSYPAVGPRGTLSVWFRNNAGTWSSGPVLLSVSNSSGISLELSVQTNGRLAITMRNDSDTIICNCLPPPNSFVVGTTYHIVMSWDLSLPELRMAINGWQVAVTKATLTKNETPRTQDQTAIGADAVGSYKFNGWLSDLFFDNQRVINLSSASERRKFYDGGWKSLGSDGSLPFGVQPPLFFSGPASEWNANKGSATGSWTVYGALDDV